MEATGVDPESGERFLFFFREDSLFSQWHASSFTLRGLSLATAEHWMMAGKALLFGDHGTLAEILAAPTPSVAKALGRKVKPFDDAVWRARSMDIVYAGNHAKFAVPERRAKLLATAGATLVEASPFDRIWGIGLAASHPDAAHRARWRGRNQLGRVLTELRDDLIAGRADARASAIVAALG